MDNETAYHLLCDESEGAGIYFSDFYGGVLVGASQLDQIESELRERKIELGFQGEVKWQKVTGNYLEKYCALMHSFFDFLRADRLKVRVMFRAQSQIPVGLSAEQRDHGYFLLYYQFIKHAFGLEHRVGRPFHLHLWFDQFPDKVEKVQRFKRFLAGLQRQPHLREAGLQIDPRHITEIRSHDHALIQCLDIVLGAMAFRLNDRHKEKNPETGRRGKRTVAKEALYRYILREIYTLKASFNPGMNTGCVNWPEDRWLMPYRHWCFEPRKSIYDPLRAKPRKK